MNRNVLHVRGRISGICLDLFEPGVDTRRHLSVSLRLMRHLLLALMIILLPVRGWLGDAMAMAQAMDAPPSQSALISKAHHREQTLGSSHSDREINADQSMTAVGHCPVDAVDTAESGPVCHPGCDGCDLCHGVALRHIGASLGGLPRPMTPPPLLGERFTSAVPAPDLKPPIS